jgi:hypothetical protein
MQEVRMFTHETASYRGYFIRPVVTRAADGRFQAAAIVEDHEGATHTLALDAGFDEAGEAAAAAQEHAIAWLSKLRHGNAFRSPVPRAAHHI